MSPFRSHPVCNTCSRRLPVAARRCPWCEAPIFTTGARPFSRILRERGTSRFASSLFEEGTGR